MYFQEALQTISEVKALYSMSDNNDKHSQSKHSLLTELESIKELLDDNPEMIPTLELSNAVVDNALTESFDEIPILNPIQQSHAQEIPILKSLEQESPTQGSSIQERSIQQKPTQQKPFQKGNMPQKSNHKQTPLTHSELKSNSTNQASQSQVLPGQQGLFESEAGATAKIATVTAAKNTIAGTLGNSLSHTFDIDPSSTLDISQGNSQDNDQDSLLNQQTPKYSPNKMDRKKNTLSDNPFLPKHVRQRLDQNAAAIAAGTLPPAYLPDAHTDNASYTERLVDQLVAQYLPKIEAELKEKLLAAVSPHKFPGHDD